VNEANILRNALPVFLSQGVFMRHLPERVLLSCPESKILKSQAKNDLSWFWPEFFLHDFTYQGPMATLDISVAEIQQLLAEFTEGHRLPSIVDWQASAKDTFEDDFEQIKRAILAGKIRKAVPITKQSASWAPNLIEKALLLSEVLKAPPNVYPFGHWTENEGRIGASPELLFSKKGESLKTVALAGTIAKPQNSPPETIAELSAVLNSNSKERYEHQEVIDAIRKKLSHLGRVDIGETRPVELPRLLHLKTEINVELKQKSEYQSNAEFFIRLIHPTPALGVASDLDSAIALNWLNTLCLQSERGRFGAPFGFETPGGEMLAIVAIRALNWNQNDSSVFAGCGIVEGSEFENEWAELSKKRESVLAQLGLL
jgi:isochorismate synthase EntC